MNQGDSPRVDTGSFRDRNGRVYLAEGRVIRGVSESALANFGQLSATGFWSEYLDQGALIGTYQIPADQAPLPDAVRQQWPGFLEHDPVPVISYPYEWSFGMLKDAALLQLDLVESAIREGMITKDATPYNFQFRDGRPVFIDIPSFEPLEPGSTWFGYRQFCEMFLFPLMLQAYKGVDFQPLLRAAIDGISLQAAARLFGFRDRFRPGVATHVWLQSRLDARFGGGNAGVRREVASAGFNEAMILANVRKMRKLVARLEWAGSGSAWETYETLGHYSETDRQLKETFVDECVRASGAPMVWDIGSNTGRYSRIAAKHARQVIAMDQDHATVERLYRGIQETGVEGLLPLVQDVADPSPCWGWNNRERLDLASRARPDLVLCLALIHHVVITASIPMQDFLRWLADTADQLIIEFVSRDDEKVGILLGNKTEDYADYSHESFRRALSEHFAIEKELALESGNRFLYWCRRS